MVVGLPNPSNTSPQGTGPRFFLLLAKINRPQMQEELHKDSMFGYTGGFGRSGEGVGTGVALDRA